MASTYKKMPHFKGQKTWTKKTPLGDVYKLQSNNSCNKEKAKIHKDSGQFGIKFTLNKTINDFIHGVEKVDLYYAGSFLEFENVLQGWYMTNWKQVLHEHFSEPVDPMIDPAEHDCSSFLIKMLNKKKELILFVSFFL